MRHCVVLRLLGGLLLLPALAQAELAVCGDTTRLYWYNPSIDPTHVPPCPAPYTLAIIADSAVVAAQRLLVEGNESTQAIPRRYLKLVDGLIVEKTQEEKDAVDAAIAAQQAAQEALEAEADDPNCRNATLAQIDTFFDNLSNNPNNTDDLAGDIAALTTNTAAAIRQMQTAILQRLVPVLRKMAKCIRATGR